MAPKAKKGGEKVAADKAARGKASPKAVAEQIVAAEGADLPEVEGEEEWEDGQAPPGTPSEASGSKGPTRKDWNQLRYQLDRAAKDGKPEQLNAYKAIKSHKGKRDFLAKMTLDKRKSEMAAVETITGFSDQADTSNRRWLTRAQILKEEGNDEEVTDAKIEELPSRLHEVQKLADKGIKQYQYSWDTETDSKGCKRKLAVEAQAACTADVFEGVEKHLTKFRPAVKSAPSRPRPKKVKDEAATVELTPEEKHLRDEYMRLKREVGAKMMEITNLKNKTKEATDKINLKEQQWMKPVVDKIGEEVTKLTDVRAELENIPGLPATEKGNQDISEVIERSKATIKAFKDWRAANKF